MSDWKPLADALRSIADAAPQNKGYATAKQLKEATGLSEKRFAALLQSATREGIVVCIRLPVLTTAGHYTRVPHYGLAPKKGSKR